MLSGVSPCAICHASVPLFMSSAVIRPYGGLISGRPWTVTLPPPSPPPRPPPPAGIGAPASVIVGPPRRRRPSPADGAALGGGAFGFRAVPCTQSKSDLVGSGFTRPSGVGDVF